MRARRLRSLSGRVPDLPWQALCEDGPGGDQGDLAPGIRLPAARRLALRPAAAGGAVQGGDAAGRRHPVVQVQDPGREGQHQGGLRQVRRGEPHWLLQGPRHDRRRQPGGGAGLQEGGLRIHREHLRLARRICREGGAGLHRPPPLGQGGRGQTGPGHVLRGQGGHAGRQLRRRPKRGQGIGPPGASLPAQLHQPLSSGGAEDGGVRDTGSARITRSRTASSCPWATPATSRPCTRP